MANGSSKKWALRDNEWCDKYVWSMLKVKGKLTKDHFSAARSSFSSGIHTIYRAVAFDIDGTLTEEGSVSPHPPMVEIVKQLLERGIHVILISGRGRTSARQAANDLRVNSKLAPWYYRRLHCVAHNGAFLLSTPLSDPESFLTSVEQLTPGIQDLESIAELVKSKVDNVQVTCEPTSIRIVLNTPENASQVHSLLNDIVLTLKATVSPDIRLMSGSYGEHHSFDIGNSNKASALEKVAGRLGIKSNQILRIGDHGEESGNDFDLLNSPHGFTVGHTSSSPTCCFPVLNETFDLEHGVSATENLIENLLLFPALRITPDATYLPALRHFERLAFEESRRQKVEFIKIIQERLDKLIPHGAPQVADIYDSRSGAVKLRDWEWAEVKDRYPFAKALFCKTIRRFASPGLLWAMHTDTGIILRGPGYYYTLSSLPKNTSVVKDYLRIVNNFLKESSNACKQILEETPSFLLFKLGLSFLDNARNFLLILSNLAFHQDEEKPRDSAWENFSTLYAALIDIVSVYYHWLTDPNSDWGANLSNAQNALQQANEAIKKTSSALANVPVNDKTIRKWRENDDFIENIIAVKLALWKLRDAPALGQSSPLILAGLLYGGLELPAIGAATYDDVELVFANISLYGDMATGNKIRQDDPQFFLDEFIPSREIVVLDRHGQPLVSPSPGPCLIMDDNVTTATTLQAANDFLTIVGLDVIGAIIVRYPSTNRWEQMLLPDHGCPNLDLFFSFIHGLASPSPYTKLLPPIDKDNPYLDANGIFNKARIRIENYLNKNNPMIRA